MRFRLGIALGFGAGYVMGTKAGRERYEQIRGWTSEMMDSPQVEKVREQATTTLERAATKLPDGLQERLPEAIRVRKIPEPHMAAPQEPFATHGSDDGRL